MSPPATRRSLAWILAAHTLAAELLGGLEAFRLGGSIGRTIVPVFAVTGLVIGCVVALTERLVARAPDWLAAALLALPSVAVTIPVGRTLFDGAYARTLPLAPALPWLVPVVVWLVLAIAIAIGRALTRDPIGSAIAILALGGALGGLAWATRHVLGRGYPDVHIAAALAILVLAGTLVRVLWSPGRARRSDRGAGAYPGFSPPLAAVIAALALGTGIAAMRYGLAAQVDRQRLAAVGDEAADLVQMWRRLLDLDRDGVSALLGGGDCDDRDPAIHPGARDIPGDGIDQDCDGHDAQPPPPPVAPPHALDLETWRRTRTAHAVLDRTRSMSILLITVDALRLDLLAPGAPHRADFPRLTRLLDQSVWFTHAIAPASGTDVSLSTLLTGRFDPYQQVATTLPEALRASERRTYSAIPGEVTRYVGDVLIGRGVQRAMPVETDWALLDVGDHVSARATTNAGLRALADAGANPAFVWLHYFDVHEHHQIKVTPGMLARVHDTGGKGVHAYRALLAQIDREVGRLLDGLAAKQLADSTIVVFASDHGEAIGDDPRLGDTHGRFAYAPLVQIPLAFRVPGVAPGRRSDAVSLVDVAPTLLALAGRPDAIRPLDGIDLVPALLDAPDALRPRGRAIAIHEEVQWSVVEWPFQLLVRPTDNLVELYHLERDPAERSDLSRELTDVVNRLEARFGEAPEVRVDRTPAGRAWREQQAQPPQRHAMP